MDVGWRIELKTDLTTELKNDPAFKAEVLDIKIRDAIRKVKERRGYENTSLTKEEIEQDLSNNYYSVIKELVLFYYNKAGADFQQAHSENGIYRTWISEDDLLKSVHAYVKVLL